MRDNIIHLSKQYISLDCVRDEILIHLGRSRSEDGVHHGVIVPETRVDVSILDLWEIQIEAIIDVRFGDSDVKTCKPVKMNKLLSGWDKIKKYKHGKA